MPFFLRAITLARRWQKPGGTLVYSTCSFARRQNEEVVQWLLDCNDRAQLAAVSLPGAPCAHLVKELCGAVKVSEDEVSPHRIFTLARSSR